MRYNKNRTLKRKMRVSRNIFGTADIPRISVNRSNEAIYAQVINDVERKTVVACSSLEIKDKKTKVEKALMTGEMLGKKMIEAKIKKAVFDRGQFAYNGRVKAIAEGIRQAGVTI